MESLLINKGLGRNMYNIGLFKVPYSISYSCLFCEYRLTGNSTAIDDHAKDGGSGEV